MVPSVPLGPISHVCESQYPRTIDSSTPVTYLCKRDALAPPKKRPRPLQQRLNLLPHSLHQILTQLLLLLPLRLQNLIHVRIDLARKSIRKKSDPRPRQRTRRTFPTGRPESGVRERIRDESADDGRLGDDPVL